MSTATAAPIAPAHSQKTVAAATGIPSRYHERMETRAKAICLPQPSVAPLTCSQQRLRQTTAAS